MKLTIPYSEALRIAKNKFGRDITLTTINEKTIKIGYDLQIKIPFTSKYIFREINIEITYEKLENEDLYMSYKGGTGLDVIIDGVKDFFPQVVNTDLFELRDGNKAIVHLGKIEKIHNALQKIIVSDVIFTIDGINILFGIND